MDDDPKNEPLHRMTIHIVSHRVSKRLIEPSLRKVERAVIEHMQVCPGDRGAPPSSMIPGTPGPAWQLRGMIHLVCERCGLRWEASYVEDRDQREAAR